MTRDECEQWHKAHPYGARTPEYMDAILAEVKANWLKYPKQRLCQLITNIATYGVGTRDPFYVLDECLIGEVEL